MLALAIISRLLAHPLTRSQKLSALSRFGRWQIASRLLPGGVAIPYIDDTRLLMTRGMTGATGNWYCGLWEADEMGFLLHFLRSTDLFLDIGANVGSHTILAAGAVGARTIAVEPVPATFGKLTDNIRLNDVERLVEAHCCALSDHVGLLAFTSGMDTLNHVAATDEGEETISVPVTTLDDLCDGRRPTVVKIDVEGHEAAVLAGAAITLAGPGIEAALLETNGAGDRYGHSDQELIDVMKNYGLTPYGYDARTRTLTPQERGGLNTIFIRDVEAAQRRCREARRYRLVSGEI